MNKNHYLINLSEHDQTDFGRVDFAEQSEPQKVFSAIWELESQVNTGGFDAYFRYADPESVAFVLTALRSIGALACAAVVEQAISLVFPAGIPSTQDESFRRLSALDGSARARLADSNHAFFVYPDNLTDLLFAYVAARPATFGSIPNDRTT